MTPRGMENRIRIVFPRILATVLCAAFEVVPVAAQEPRLHWAASPSRAAMDQMTLAKATESRFTAARPLTENGGWGRREWLIAGGVTVAVAVVVAVIVSNSGDDDGGNGGGGGGGGYY
jgi:hypothetical protein